jgi:hypothetical protein
MNSYSKKQERSMKCLYNSLDEASKRRYAGVEAEKLGHGGKKYITGLFQCSVNTLYRGQKEILSGLKGVKQGRIRNTGGGCKLKKNDPFIQQLFWEVIGEHTAGDPCDKDKRWTYLHQQEIAEAMKEKGVAISRTVVKQLLKQHGYVKRKSQKKKAIGKSKNRNEQFENIQRLKEFHQEQGDPVISMDTKKKSQ